MADFENRTSSRSKWLWLLLIVLLAVVLLLWVFGAADDDQPGELAAPIGVTDESALPAPQEGEIAVELPKSDFELPEAQPAPEPEADAQ